MKKKLSILLIGSLIAISFAGCSGNNQNNTSQSSAQDSLNSETSSELSSLNDNSEQDSENSDSSDQSEINSDTSSQSDNQSDNSVSDNNSSSADESTVIEEIDPSELSDIIIDETQLPDDDLQISISDEDVEAPQSEYLDYSMNIIDISDKGIATEKTDLSKNPVHIIRSTSELDTFKKQYGNSYVLNTVDSGDTFDTLTKNYNNDFFGYSSLIVIPVQYEDGSEPDLGEIRENGSKIDTVLYTKKPSDTDKAHYVCFVVAVDSNRIKDKTVNLIVSDAPVYIEGEE